MKVNDEFHSPIKRKVNTLESVQRGAAVGIKTLYDVASLFSRLITAGQHRQVGLQLLFDYELCAVPSSISDEYRCLRTGTIYTLLSKQKVDDLQPATPSRQHLYCIVWSCAESRQQYEGQFH